MFQGDCLHIVAATVAATAVAAETAAVNKTRAATSAPRDSNRAKLNSNKRSAAAGTAKHLPAKKTAPPTTKWAPPLKTTVVAASALAIAEPGKKKLTFEEEEQVISRCSLSWEDERAAARAKSFPVEPQEVGALSRGTITISNGSSGRNQSTGKSQKAVGTAAKVAKRKRKSQLHIKIGPTIDGNSGHKLARFCCSPTLIRRVPFALATLRLSSMSSLSTPLTGLLKSVLVACYCTIALSSLFMFILCINHFVVAAQQHYYETSAATISKISTTTAPTSTTHQLRQLQLHLQQPTINEQSTTSTDLSYSEPPNGTAHGHELRRAGGAGRGLPTTTATNSRLSTARDDLLQLASHNRREIPSSESNSGGVERRASSDSINSSESGCQQPVATISSESLKATQLDERKSRPSQQSEQLSLIKPSEQLLRVKRSIESVPADGVGDNRRQEMAVHLNRNARLVSGIRGGSGSSKTAAIFRQRTPAILIIDERAGKRQRRSSTGGRFSYVMSEQKLRSAPTQMAAVATAAASSVDSNRWPTATDQSTNGHNGKRLHAHRSRQGKRTNSPGAAVEKAMVERAVVVASVSERQRPASGEGNKLNDHQSATSGRHPFGSTRFPTRVSLPPTTISTATTTATATATLPLLAINQSQPAAAAALAGRHSFPGLSFREAPAFEKSSLHSLNNRGASLSLGFPSVPSSQMLTSESRNGESIDGGQWIPIRGPLVPPSARSNIMTSSQQNQHQQPPLPPPTQPTLRAPQAAHEMDRPLVPQPPQPQQPSLLSAPATNGGNGIIRSPPMRQPAPRNLVPPTRDQLELEELNQALASHQNYHHHHHHSHHNNLQNHHSARHWRRPRLNPVYELADELHGPSPLMARPSKMYKRVLLCDKTLVSLDYVRHFDPFGHQPGGAPSPLGGSEYFENNLEEIRDNFIDDLESFHPVGPAVSTYDMHRADSTLAPVRTNHNITVPVSGMSSINGTAAPVNPVSASAATSSLSSASSQQVAPPIGLPSNSLSDENQATSNQQSLQAAASDTQEFVFGRRMGYSTILNDEDPLVKCDMWDLEKGLKNRKPPEFILRQAVKADFDTVRDAINRCRQLSEKTLPPDDEYRDGLVEIMSTEDLISLFSMKRGLMPGTKWCGLGDQANQYNDLGPKHRIDICCRAHDHCPIRSKPFRNDYGILNIGLYTKSHCDCDADFYRCLREVKSRTADMLGNLYFNVMKLQCMREERLKVCREMKPIALGFERCVRYEDSPMRTVFKFTTPPVAY